MERPVLISPWIGSMRYRKTDKLAAGEKPVSPAVSKAHFLKNTYLFELGDSFARLLSLEKNNVKGFREIIFQREVATDTRAYQQALKDWLESVIGEFKIKEQTPVRLLLSGKLMYARKLENLMSVAKKDLEEAIVWQIADKVPFAIEKSKMVYEKRGKQVLVAGVEVDYLESVIATFHSVLLRPEIVSLVPLAYEAFFQRMESFSGKNLLFVSIDREVTSLIIFSQNQFQSVREIRMGGVDIVQALTGSFVIDNNPIMVSAEEAQLIKDRIGLPTPDLLSPVNEPKLSQFCARMRPIFERIVAEMRSTIVNFEKQSRGLQISSIYVGGQEANLKGLNAYLAKQLNLQVYTLDMSAYAGLDLLSAPLLGVSLLKHGKFNFASSSDIWEMRLGGTAAILRKACLGVVLMYVVICLGITSLIFAQIKKRNSLEREFENLGTQPADFRRFQELSQSYAIQSQLIRKHLEPQPVWSSIFRTFAKIVPPTMTLTHLFYKAEKRRGWLVIDGRVVQGQVSPALTLSQFLLNLNKSVYFDNSRLESRNDTQQDPQRLLQETGINFVIKTQVLFRRVIL